MVSFDYSEGQELWPCSVAIRGLKPRSKFVQGTSPISLRALLLSRFAIFYSLFTHQDNKNQRREKIVVAGVH